MIRPIVVVVAFPHERGEEQERQGDSGTQVNPSERRVQRTLEANNQREHTLDIPVCLDKRFVLRFQDD